MITTLPPQYSHFAYVEEVAPVEEEPSYHSSTPTEEEEPTITGHSTYNGTSYDETEHYTNTNGWLVWYVLYTTEANGQKVEHCYDKNHKEISCAKDDHVSAAAVIVIILIILILGIIAGMAIFGI